VTRRQLAFLSAVAAGAIAVGACSGTGAVPARTYTPSILAAAPSASPAAPTASPSSAPVTTGEIAVTMTDTMRFEPGNIALGVGATVTFVVTNVGLLPHEFFVGDADEQTHHAAEMAEGSGHAHDDTLRLDAGETGRVTMTFDLAETLVIGCHEPGHYEAGMVGSIDVID